MASGIVVRITTRAADGSAARRHNTRIHIILIGVQTANKCVDSRIANNHGLIRVVRTRYDLLFISSDGIASRSCAVYGGGDEKF